MTAVLVVLLAALMQVLLTYSPEGTAGSTGTTLAFGYMLLTAYFVGTFAGRLKLPRLTGYLVAGLAVGPAALGLVSQGMLESLEVVNGMAVALIALTAGTELELRTLRPLYRTIAWLSVVAVGGTAVVLAVTVYLGRGLLPFMAGRDTVEALAIAAVLGSVMVAQSPAVVVALRSEMRADGPLVHTVLGVVVIADLLVILLFAVASSVARSTMGGNADVGATIGALVWQLVGSLVLGVIVGLLLALYLRRVHHGAALFVITVAFVIAEVGGRLDFDPLLLALSAGLAVRNLTRVGDELHEYIESSSLPVYVLFFAVAGASIHLDSLAVMGAPALLFVFVRGASLLAGARLAGWLGKATPVVRRYAGLGLLPQAGLALALSTLFARTFPEFGGEAAALTLAVVAVNELVAPALYRAAIARSGEAGAGAALVTPGSSTIEAS